MKERLATRALLVVSCLVLVTRGIDARSNMQRENSSQIITNRQLNTTITMEGGDVFGCIDVNLQPSFDHPLLKDHKIQMKPSSLPIGHNIPSPVLHVVSQARLPIVECPTGMVPILRNDGRDQRATHITEQVINMDDQLEEAGIKYRDDFYGVRATINVYEPKVKKDSKDLSQSGIQIDNGPRGHVESIAACYSVAPSFVGDSFVRFHVAWDPKTKNWWVTYGEENTPIGYWPSSLFSYIKDKGNFSYWGGHVSGPTASSDSPQIGSGHFASEGNGKAAFMRNIQIVDGNNKLVTPNRYKDVVGTSDTSKYSVDGYEVNNHGIHMYYGGPGNFV